MPEVFTFLQSPAGAVSATCLLVALLAAPWWARHLVPVVVAARGHRPPVELVSEDIEIDSLSGLTRLAAGFAVPVIAIDPEGIIRVYNASAENLTGWRREEVIGTSVSILMGEPHNRRHAGYVRDYLQERAAGTRPALLNRERQVEVRHRDGRAIACIVYVTEYINGWHGFWAWIQLRQLEE